MIDPTDDTLIVVDEHYQADWTIKQHAEKLKQLIEQYGDPRWIVADPEDKGARMSLSRDHGIANVPARKGRGSVKSGINSVCERLAPDVEGRPHLLVFDRCKNLIMEFEQYVWDERGVGESNDQPRPRQKDHALDALRYCCMRLGVGDLAMG
jgi:phage terminase large subunit